MKMEAWFDKEPDAELRELAKKFKEDAKQATARLAVASGKELANKSWPWGLGTRARKSIEKNVTDSAKRVCYVIPPKSAALITRLKAGGRGARVKYGTWEQVLPGQFKTDPRQINRQIDKVRDGYTNPPDYIPWGKMVVCSTAAFNKAMTMRRKRIGMNKGGWLGAGIAAARFQAGPDRAKIGKNVANWAQKHRNMGSARVEWPFITLLNSLGYSEGLLPEHNRLRALDDAWDRTVAWYKKAIKRREKNWDACTHSNALGYWRRIWTPFPG